jgi:hypothetical protein
LKQLEGFRIKRDEGLVTTRPRSKDTVVTGFAPPGVAAFAQPSIRPNTRVVKRQLLKATKDIPVNTAVTVPAGGKIPSVSTPPPPPKKKKLVKPYYDPKWDEPPPPPAQQTRITRKKRQNARVLQPSEKFERGMRKRLKALQELFSDQKLAERLKIQPSKHVIKIPSKAADMDKASHKLLIAERKRWVKYINQNPRNKMTDDKAHDLIEKLAKG